MAPLIAAIPLILVGISAASAGVGIYEALNQPKPPAPPTQTNTQTQQAASEQAAAIAQATALSKRRGMASTILTSPMGASGPSQSQSATLGT